MRRSLILLIIALLASVQARADKVLERFTEKVSASRVEFGYEYSVKGKVPVTGKGSAIVQGESFRVKGDGLEIVCNALVRKTIDYSAKEIIIEEVSVDGTDYASNPALLISSAGAAFDVTGATEKSFRGRKAHEITLSPKVRAGISLARLYFHEGNLAGASITMPDGTVTEFVIADLKFSPVSDGSDFSFDEKSLDKSWIITDLR